MITASETGKEGERLAAEYLSDQGYMIIAKNWKYRKLEIDLVGKTAGKIIFFEVKSVSGKAIEAPEQRVKPGKQKFLLTAANAFILEHDIELEAQFDIVTVDMRGKKPIINHLKEAFGPEINSIQV